MENRKLINYFFLLLFLIADHLKLGLGHSNINWLEHNDLLSKVRLKPRVKSLSKCININIKHTSIRTNNKSFLAAK